MLLRATSRLAPRAARVGSVPPSLRPLASHQILPPPPQRVRTFLPGLSKLAGQSVARHRSHQWQRVIQFPPGTIYSVVADVSAYDQFLPFCIASKVAERQVDDEGNATLQTGIRVGFATMQSQFSSTVTLTPLKRVHADCQPNEYLENLSFSWDFSPVGERACRLDLRLGALPSRLRPPPPPSHLRRPPQLDHAPPSSDRPKAQPVTALCVPPGADFSLHSAEHALMWDFVEEKIIEQYLDAFQKRCEHVEARASK